MSLKSNIGFNYLNLIYSTVIGIVVMPVFYNIMGEEAFGLIGYYTILQTWFVLLDFGLSASISRECSRFRGGVILAGALRSLIRSIEKIFIFFAVIGVSIIFLFSDFISKNWIDSSAINQSTLSLCIKIMILIIALRWMSGLYRGVLNGFEKQVWTSAFGMVISTLRFPVALLVLIYVNSEPVTYFSYQLLIALLELFVSFIKASRAIPVRTVQESKKFDASLFLTVIKFSLSISVLGIVTTLVSQVDKVILSSVLSLKDYGEFSLVTVFSGGVILLGGPVASAIIPRLSKAYAENNQQELHELYRQASVLTGLFVCAAGAFIAIFSNELLYVWTGSSDLASRMWLTLSIYSVANAIYVVASFPHYLQYACGNLKIQLRYSVFILVILIPTIIWSATNFGLEGAAVTWLLVNVLGLLIVSKIVHRRFLPGNNITWFRSIIFPVAASSIIFGVFYRLCSNLSEDRLFLSIELLFIGFLFLILIACFSSDSRKLFVKYIPSYRGI